MNNGLKVREIVFYNRAPFDNLYIRFIDGVNVLSGENGRGKTTIMSYIVDALYEIAKKLFSQSFSGHETEWYRIQSGIEVMDVERVSVVYIRFEYQGNKIDYIDVRGSLTKEIYNALYLPADPIPFISVKEELGAGKMGKCCYFFRKEEDESIFTNHLATYFPAYRYELPAYLNERYQLDESPFNRSARFHGYLPNLIEVVSDVDNITNWLLDVVLDLEISDDDSDEKTSPAKEAPEHSIWRNACNVLGWALLAKKKEDKIRFGIGRRHYGASRVSVICEDSEGELRWRIPSVSYLSSGEKGLLGIFGEILRQADRIQPNIQPIDTDGLVLIDEIDKHLHIRLQKEALPQLISQFPNIQFIISSHSPFLNMGLADKENVPCQIIDLDAGGVTCAPRNNLLYQQVYEMLLKEKEQFADDIKALQNKLASATKTIVLTEGKTDIIHINKAKEKLCISLDYDTISPENQPDGESDLMALLKQVSKTPNSHKIIGIFDCDTKTTKDFGIPFEDFGNNVYAFKILPPKARIEKGQNAISIEYLYSDDEIKTMLPNHTRLFLGTEFSTRTGRHKENKDWILANQSDRGKDKVVENENGQAVYDAEEKNYLAKKSDFANAIADDIIAVSNESWENFRHIFEIIEDIVKNDGATISSPSQKQ